MIYVISKSTFGSYNVRDIQCNANWDCCPYSDYALIPDNLVDGILATKGYCDITLNSAGNEVASFTAREIPSVPEECCGTNTVLTVNGVAADTNGEVTLTPEAIGASAIGHKHAAGDITSGTLKTARLPTVPVDKGGTGATDAATARSNLGASAAGHNHANEEIKPMAIELVPPSGQNHGGYIDFHFNGATDDFTSRIIEQASGVLHLNGRKILTRGDIVDRYNQPLEFTDGVATFESPEIKYTSVVMVQRRGNIAGASLSFCTQTQDGILTITTDKDVNGTIYVNMLISYL